MVKRRREAIAFIKNMMVASMRPWPAQFRRTLPQPLGHIILQLKAISWKLDNLTSSKDQSVSSDGRQPLGVIPGSWKLSKLHPPGRKACWSIQIAMLVKHLSVHYSIVHVVHVFICSRMCEVLQNRILRYIEKIHITFMYQDSLPHHKLTDGFLPWKLSLNSNSMSRKLFPSWSATQCTKAKGNLKGCWLHCCTVGHSFWRTRTKSEAGANLKNLNKLKPW